MSLRQQLELADKQLADCHDEQLDRFDFTFSVIGRAYELALKHHAAEAIDIARRVTGPLSPGEGGAILAAMLATLGDSELLNLSQAAGYLGYSTHGLRKIVKQGLIKFTRNGQGPYHFRQEWLDEFAAARSDRRPAQKRRAPVTPRHGFPSC